MSLDGGGRGGGNKIIFISWDPPCVMEMGGGGRGWYLQREGDGIGPSLMGRRGGGEERKYSKAKAPLKVLTNEIKGGGVESGINR